MSAYTLLQLVIVVVCVAQLYAFHVSNSMINARRFGSKELSMEYIPDGLTKAQWEAIKKKEAEELKAKGNMGALGTNRFKSRSMEAWQKSGAKHLFPVNPTEVPYEERPYMQRRGGDWEGKDLQKVGLQGKGQGQAFERLKVDDVYEVAAKEGRLNSVSIFGGLPLPWTSEAAAKMNNQLSQAKVTGKEKAKAGKQLSEEEMRRLKATLAKPIAKQATSAKIAPAPASTEENKKKRFGLF